MLTFHFVVDYQFHLFKILGRLFKEYCKLDTQKSFMSIVASSSAHIRICTYVLDAKVLKVIGIITE